MGTGPQAELLWRSGHVRHVPNVDIGGLSPPMQIWDWEKRKAHRAFQHEQRTHIVRCSLGRRLSGLSPMPEFRRYAALVALHGAYRRSVDVSRGGLQRTCPVRRVQQGRRAERTARSLQYRGPEWQRGGG